MRRCGAKLLIAGWLMVSAAAWEQAAGSEIPDERGDEQNLSEMHAEHLLCDGIVDPLGIDSAQPRLSWRLISAERGQRQTAYQILAATSLEQLAADTADLWDSGRVASAETVDIRYEGRSLDSAQQVFWKVRVWGTHGWVSAWSRPATWTMGFVDASRWRARWITHPDFLEYALSRASDPSEQSSDRNEAVSTDPNDAAGNPESESSDAASATDGEGLARSNLYANSTLRLRREFRVRSGLRRALVFVCGLGQYEMSLNGQRIGSQWLSPGWTDYAKTCLYDTHDVTNVLQEGSNAIGLTLADGMYNLQEAPGRYTKFVNPFRPLTAIVHVRLEYENGTVTTYRTDNRWRLALGGPITFSNIYAGQDCDARIEPNDWDRSDFEDDEWASPAFIDGPGGILRGSSYAAPPLGTFETVEPVSRTVLSPGIQVYDLGQNASRVLKIRLKGPRGAVVRVIPAELLNDDGSVDRRSCAHGGAAAWWQYALAGDPNGESWEPRFFYHGCRYLQVECSAPETGGELPAVESIEGPVFHATVEPVGQFGCSNELFNRIRQLVRWAQRSNLVSVITDCPHRERLGWLEQYHLNGPSLRYEFDLTRLYDKTLGDMVDAQLENGLVPSTAPEYTIFPDGFRDSPEWGSAIILSAWQHYLWTGSDTMLRRNYSAMSRYFAYLTSRAEGHILSHGLGDWYDLGPKPPGTAQLTPVALTATAIYYEDALAMARIAGVLNQPGEAARYERLAGEIREAFNEAFFDPNAKRYAAGSQTANATAYALGLVQPGDAQAVLDAIVADIRERGNALTSGDVGYRYLLRALAEGGRSDVIYEMNNQLEKPGYGYQLAQGATSLAEAWDARRTSSQNHFMLGQIIEWFYRDLAGIAPDPAAPGFKNVIIKPQPVGDLTWVTGSYDSVRGRIVSHWERQDGSFTLNVTIPPNTTATVYVPTRRPDALTESGVIARQSPGVRFLRAENGAAVFQVTSGRYVFQSSL